LAIAAAKLGAAHVHAVDIRPDAVCAAAAMQPRTASPMRTAVPEELAPTEYDLVVSTSSPSP